MPQIAVQLYTVRDFLKSPAEVAATLKRVKEIGYDAVELAGLGSTDAKQWAAYLKDNGLRCCGAHIPSQMMAANIDLIIEHSKTIGVKNIAVPIFRGTSAADYEKFADQLNPLAKTFAAAGIRLGYHNHSHELVNYGGHTALEILLRRFDKLIGFELDTYWLVHGGADPVDWLARCAGRAPCVHLKDMIIDASGVQQMAEVGAGNLNWKAILKACAQANTEWLIVEQDICQDDPFECLGRSLRNLRPLTA